MGVGFDVESEGTHVVRVSFDVETGVSQSRKRHRDECAASVLR